MEYLFSYQKMEELLNHFLNLTDARFSLFDAQFNMVCNSGNQSAFCDMIVQNRECGKECPMSDNYHMFKAGKRPDELYIFRCHCGILNAIVPIIHDNVPQGYLMFGQILDQTSMDDQWAQTKELLSWCKTLDMHALKDAFYQLPQYTEERIVSCSKILDACTDYIRIQGIVRMMNASLEDQLDLLIQSRFREPLTLSSLASELNISKSKLCSIAAKRNTTVTAMINDQRMKVAANLLVTTNRNISEISAMVGMSDYNYFSKLFKSYSGVTPRAYRRSHTTKAGKK